MDGFGPRAALVVVDLQNDFADPSGSLAVTGAEGVVPVVNAAIRKAVQRGSLVVATQDWHPPTTPHFAKDGGTWPVHGVAGTWGAELHADLVIPADAPRVRKGAAGEDGYSGFSMRDPESGAETRTELDRLLRERQVERVVVCGLATDYCIKATALDAVRLGYEVELLTGGFAAVDLNAGDGVRALDEMRAAGVRITESRSPAAPPDHQEPGQDRAGADDHPRAVGSHETARGEREAEPLRDPHSAGEQQQDAEHHG